MKTVQVYKDGNMLGSAALADNYFLRLRGLIGRNAEDVGGMLISPCSQIHTFFMKETIDVVYMGKSGYVLHLDPSVPPGKCMRSVRGCKKVLELPDGKAGALGISKGSILQIKKA